ncbi:hypothetical protein BJ912DRAFT_957336 [Pholiota molesta]|nr:hypothetical protein BJ912DRAFT_957336 [Pholiota molesta]
MPEASPEIGLDACSSQVTENTPLLAASSSKVPVETTTSSCTNWKLPSHNRRSQSKGKLSIRQKSPSSSYSLLSDSSDKENDLESSNHRRRNPSEAQGLVSIDQQYTSRPTSSITIEGVDETFKTHSGAAGSFSQESTPQAPYSTPTSSPWSLYEGFLPSSVSLRLENSGSVARDHLASERTFLAYMRTSLAIAASGVALVQLFSAASSATPQKSAHRLHQYIQPLGAGTILIGLMVLFIGVVRYFTIQFALIKGYFPVARLTTGFIAVILTALVTLTFSILIAGKLTPKA